MALASTLAQGVEPPEHRRRPPRNNNREGPSEVELQVTTFRCQPSHPLLPWATVLPGQDTPSRRMSLGRSRSTTPAICRNSLGGSCWKGPISHSFVSCFFFFFFFFLPWGLHLLEPGSSTTNTSIRRLALSLRNLPTPWFPRRSPPLPSPSISPSSSFFQYTQLSVLTVHEAKSTWVFWSDLLWLDHFPFEERQQVHHSVQLFLLSPRSTSNSQKFNIIHLAGYIYEFVASKWILWRVKFSINECSATNRIHKINEIQQLTKGPGARLSWQLLWNVRHSWR